MPWLTDVEGKRYYVRKADYERYGPEAERMIREARAKAADGAKPSAKELLAQIDATEFDTGFDYTEPEIDADFARWLEESEADLRRNYPHLARILDGPPPRPRCGARTRGLGNPPCRAPAVNYGKRCRMHGGLSCGATTEEGRERVDAARKRRWDAYRAAKAAEAGAKPDSGQ